MEPDVNVIQSVFETNVVYFKSLVKNTTFETYFISQFFSDLYIIKSFIALDPF